MNKSVPTQFLFLCMAAASVCGATVATAAPDPAMQMSGMQDMSDMQGMDDMPGMKHNSPKKTAPDRHQHSAHAMTKEGAKPSHAERPTTPAATGPLGMPEAVRER